MIRLLIGLLLSTLLTTAHAHRLNLFAMSDGSSIDGYAYFPGGRRASDLPVHLEQDGRRLAEQHSDTEGRFRFPLAGQRGLLTVVAQSGDGHLVRFPIEIAAEDAPLALNSALPATVTPPDSPATCPPPLDPTTLQAAIHAQIRPLREQLDALASQRRWQDVVGGIGYILGLFGLAALFYTRQRP